jgi:hypothetical protein
MSNAVAQTVYTPNGSQVPSNALFTYSSNWALGTTNSQLQSFEDDVSSGVYGSSCVVLGGYSRQYNCHGYAWHVSTGGSQIAIDQPNYGGVSPYVSGSNPSYTETTYSNQGKLRVRYSGDHSAVTTYYSGLYISKWGPGPLVRHNATDVMYGYGSPSTYWTCYYTPPLQSVQLGYTTQSGTTFPVSVGSHSLSISYGLDPDTAPYFQSTNSSTTTITSQSGNSTNFTYNGTNVGGVSVTMCGTYRYSFMFYNGGGGRIAVYPNPAEEEATVELLDSSEEQYLIPMVDDTRLRIRELFLLDENNEIKQSYNLSALEGINKIRFEKGQKGVYYLKAVFSDGTSQTKRILIRN